MTEKKLPIITDDEKKLFQNAVSNIKPLKPAYQNTFGKIKTKRILVKKPIDFSEKKIIFNFAEKLPDISGEDVIAFSQSGLQRKQRSQLKRGKIHIEATLDLHQHTRDEAISETEAFLKRCQNKGFRCVCIIHGKGNYSSNNQPIIKNLLNNYLRHHPLVLAFHSAKNKQGGTGAMIVLLKTA